MTEEKFFEPVEAFEQKLKGDKEFLVTMATTLAVFASLSDPIKQAAMWMMNKDVSGTLISLAVLGIKSVAPPNALVNLLDPVKARERIRKHCEKADKGETDDH